MWYRVNVKISQQFLCKTNKYFSVPFYSILLTENGNLKLSKNYETLQTN